jgi:hypothetical protein
MLENGELDSLEKLKKKRNNPKWSVILKKLKKKFIENTSYESELL